MHSETNFVLLCKQGGTVECIVRLTPDKNRGEAFLFCPRGGLTAEGKETLQCLRKRKSLRLKMSGIVMPLVFSVTGDPVPAYISAGSSKAVTVPVLTDAAFSP